MGKLSKPNRTVTNWFLWLTALPYLTTTKTPILWTNQEFFQTLRLCTGCSLLQNALPAFTSCLAIIPRSGLSLEAPLPARSEHRLGGPRAPSAPSCKTLGPYANHTSRIQRHPVFSHHPFPPAGGRATPAAGQPRQHLWSSCHCLPRASIKTCEWMSARGRKSQRPERSTLRSPGNQSLWRWDGEMVKQAHLASFPEAGVKSQLTSPAPVAFSSFMDSSKECCTAHTLDGTEDPSMQRYLKRISLKSVLKKKRKKFRRGPL